MNIGIIYKSGKSNIGLLQIPFLIEQNFLLLANKEKTKDTAPDFNVMARVAGQLTSIGGVWNKTSENGFIYKSMTIEHPLAFKGKLNFAIFEAKDQKTYKRVKDGKTKEDLITHNIVYSAPKPKEDSNNFQTSGQVPQQQEEGYYPPDDQFKGGNQKVNDNSIPEIDIDDSEIPF